LKGDVQAAVELFDLINRRAPQGFRKITPSKDNIFTSKLHRHAGSVESMKENFLFIKCSVYPKNIFSHRSSSDPDIFDEFSIGQEINFRVRFNRAGPMGIDIRPGRLITGI
jgi:hypothetical protein